jgi:hypothetical protein
VPLIVPLSDKVFEEARVYRHHYGESVILDVLTSKNRLGRMEKFGNHDKLAYSSLTRQYDPMLEAGNLMLIATVSGPDVNRGTAVPLPITGRSISVQRYGR